MDRPATHWFRCVGEGKGAELILQEVQSQLREFDRALCVVLTGMADVSFGKKRKKSELTSALTWKAQVGSPGAD